MNAPVAATPEQVIGDFIDRFYARVFKDPLLAPVFLAQAGIDPAVHIPHIKAYWRKMLLGDPAYRRHMMQKHRDLHQAGPLTQQHYDRWLSLFERSLDESAPSELIDRARTLGRRVAGNMRRNLEATAGCI
ncbi:MAG: group III truncated hemoglobin [Pseudomonadota bacterium]